MDPIPWKIILEGDLRMLVGLEQIKYQELEE